MQASNSAQASNAAPPAVSLPRVTQPAPGHAPAWSSFDPETRRPTVLLAILIGLFLLVPPIVSEALPTTPIPISSQLEITPAAGWVWNTDVKAGVRLQKGRATLDLLPRDAGQTADAIAQVFIDGLRKTDPNLETGPAETLADGGVRITYSGVFGTRHVSIDGHVTAYAFATSGVVVEAFGTPGALEPYRVEIDRMLATISVVE